jgi:RND family efflux transporter MFP subunit
MCTSSARRLALVSVTPLLSTVLLAGCGGDRPAAAGPPARQPVTVGIVEVSPRPVERFTDYVATVRSQRSSEVRPQVEGIVTRIYVRSGQRVAAGAPLLQIDPARQEAAVSSSAASRAAQDAELRLARQELDRQRALFADGLVSKQGLDQAVNRVETAEAALDSLKAREDESRVQLRYYRVSAPTPGVIGDIPVRVGDRVTTSTLLTTLDEGAGLEVYIHVPVERAPDLSLGQTVRLLDDRGEGLADLRVSFISPQVDDRTQAVLVKAAVPNGHGLRSEQFVRARLVWSNEPAITVPALSVARVASQYYAYVAEPGDDGLVARRRPVRLGTLAGNDYVVLEGLQPGERVIVSGIQKINDGVPVKPEA